MSNPYLDRQAAKVTNAHGKVSEKRVGKAMGARMHANSGATRGSKSDASLKAANFRLEMKSTVNQMMALERGWLVKIAQEAVTHGQIPAVVVSFVLPDGKTALRYHAEWVLLPLEAFKELTATE